jgi:tight adherence protein B
VRRLLLTLAVGLAVAVPAGAQSAGPRITAVDTTAYPTVRATVVTPQPQSWLPRLEEDGRAVAGFEATNLGRAKSIVLAIDRSQSMRGPAMANAAAAARAFVAAKPLNDRIQIVAFGSSATSLTGFSTARIDADAALRDIAVDGRQGTALYDAVALAADQLRTEPYQGRVIVVLTDGDDVSSETSLAAAARAAREAGAAVFAIAIESADFSPAPLRRIADQSGGRYFGASSSSALQAVYASVAEELRRTWQVSYVTAARPGERLELTLGETSAEAVVPGRSVRVEAAEPQLPEPVFSIGAELVALLVGGCAFVALAFLLRVPRGTLLKRQIAPHLGEIERTRSRGRVQERFATASSLMQATEKAFGHLRAWHALHRLLERADVPLRTVELVYAAAGSGVVIGLLFAVAGAPSLLTLAAMVAGGAVPIVVVWFKAKRRLAAFEDQLPDLLITLAASLKAGHSFRQGIQAVVDEGMEPANKEFNRVLTETRLGRPMDDALGEMAERVGSKNLRFVITAVTIQRQVGGSLAGIFDMVAEAVRNRQQFARKIRSLTAMGRMSAYTLVGIPFFLLAAITLMNREYMDPLYHTSTGHWLMVIGLAMIAFGSLILKKIVSFKG